MIQCFAVPGHSRLLVALLRRLTRHLPLVIQRKPSNTYDSSRTVSMRGRAYGECVRLTGLET
jgi:hypothetical protein